MSTLKISGPGNFNTSDDPGNLPDNGQFYGFLHGALGWFLVPYSSIVGAPSTSAGVVGADSITGTTTLTLVNDLLNPGSDKVYGTDSTGNRGYRSAAGLPVNYGSITGTPVIPTVGTLNTPNSITGGGSMSGNLTVSLSGDSASPGNTMLYGTNASGTKGWFAQPSVTGGTSVGSDSITGTTTLTLVNDSASPGNTMLYGTDSSGARGWYAQPSGGGGSSTGAKSITGTTTLTLVNDVTTPSEGQFYGFVSGARGWFIIPYAALSGTPSLGTSAAKDIPSSGNASVTQVVYGSDTRLSDARTPSSHATSHKSGGGDSIKLDELAAPTDITTLNASSSAHGLMPKADANAAHFYSSDGTQKLVAYSSLGSPPTLGTSAAKDIPASGNASATQVVYGSDTRLADSRTPSAHATSHKSGGTDAIALDTLAAATDVTTLNATSGAHGLLAKTSGTATDFIGGDNASHAHSTIPLDTLGAPTDIVTRNATSLVHGLLAKTSGTATDFVGGDNACHAHSTVALDTLGSPTDVTTLNASSSAHGLMPKADGNAAHFYCSDGTQKAVAAGVSPWRQWNANEGLPPSTLYAVWSNVNSIPFLAFNASVTWSSVFMGKVPAGVTLASGVIVRLLWGSATATSGNVIWGVAIERFGILTVVSDHFDTQATATTTTNGSVSILTETAITQTAINSMTNGNTFRLQVQRTGGTMVGDAQLFSVSIESA
jgi:hypothetical protein